MMSHEEELRVVQWQRNFMNTKQPLLSSSSGAQMSNVAIKKPLVHQCTVALRNSSAVAHCSRCPPSWKVRTDLGSGHLLCLHKGLLRGTSALCEAESLSGGLQKNGWTQVVCGLQSWSRSLRKMEIYILVVSDVTVLEILLVTFLIKYV